MLFKNIINALKLFFKSITKVTEIYSNTCYIKYSVQNSYIKYTSNLITLHVDLIQSHESETQLDNNSYVRASSLHLIILL